MKVGSVWDRGTLFPTARLEIELDGYGPVPVVAFIDTGFTEWLALPPDAIERLGLKWVDNQPIGFGNSLSENVDIYEARVYWGKVWRTVRVHQVLGNPTIGMELLRGHRIEFDALGDAAIDVEAVES